MRLDYNFRENLFNLIVWLIAISILGVFLILSSGSVEGFTGVYQHSTGIIGINTSVGMAQYVFLHELGHKWYAEELWWHEKARFRFNTEIFAETYANSYECKLKHNADDRIKKIFWWDK